MARQNRALEAIEDEFILAWEYLARSPDKERGFLLSGRRSGWPDIVRDRITDYADTEAPPRLQLSRKQVELRDRYFVDQGCLSKEIAPANIPLVAIVLTWKRWPPAGGFRWEDVWEVMGGRESGTTTDGLSKRYERVLRRLIAVKADRAVAAGHANSDA